MSAKKILYLGPAETLDQVRAKLRPHAVVYALSQFDVEGVIDECDVILDAYMKVRFSKDVLRASSRLVLFVAASTGVDHVDQTALAGRGIPLFSLRERQALLRRMTAAAEHSWLLLLACARRLRSAVDDVVSGGWNRNDHPGIMLRGKTLGIVGCGRIGQLMARYGAAFDMTVRGFDPFVSPWPPAIESVPLEELVPTSDFITIHVPLRDETRHLLGPTQFDQMRRGVVVVNTSRGDVIDETALLQSLATGTVAAAGLDVLSGEPDVAGHPLVEYSRAHRNLIITPHIAGYSPEALEQVLTDCCNRIRTFLENMSPRSSGVTAANGAETKSR